MTIEDGTLYTFNEVLKFLKISRSTLYRLISGQKILAHKVGNSWRFYGKDVRAAVENPHGEPSAA